MKKVLSVILCVLWMGFIFYNSSNNGIVSNKKSYNILNDLKNEYHSFIHDKKILNSKKSANIEKSSNGNAKLNNKVELSGKANKSVSRKEKKFNTIIRKNAHAFEYCVLSILISCLLFSFNLKGKNAIIYVMFLCLFYAVTDEFHQVFIPGRGSSVIDVLIDFAGSMLGILIFYIIYYKIYLRVHRKRCYTND